METRLHLVILSVSHTSLLGSSSAYDMFILMIASFIIKLIQYRRNKPSTRSFGHF
eukprot:c7110_g1_i1 orf=1-162(-)